MALPTSTEIADRAATLRAGIEAAAARARQDPHGVRVVAVTKTWPVEVCRSAVDAGLTALGENRVQEALPKVAAIPDAEWHLVGHLQSNKARAAVGAFGWIHSVDSAALLRRIDAAAHDLHRAPRVLLQVNVTGEPRQHGLGPTELASAELLGAIAGLRDARLVGLMGIARAAGDPRPDFARLRGLRDQLQQRLGSALPELSMGMSGDHLVAVEEGATLVRIGTALFGRRDAPDG
ncbi:MAG: YggS family pyridoxal phosphate-dependent enzyme [Chloroflexota bacterium]